MTAPDDIYDVAIVGGGLSGYAAAAALGQAGFSCALIDPARPEETLSDAFDGRVTALAYASQRMLARLGVWEALAPDAQAINDILVTDGRRRRPFAKGGVSGFHLHFDPREMTAAETDAPLGWMVENRHFRRALFQGVDAAPTVDLRQPAKQTGVTYGPAFAEIHLDTEDTLKARLVVAADGRASPLREAAGIRKMAWGYGQTAIVATVVHEKPHKGVAQEYFLPAGPFAILPVTGDRASLVWTEEERLAPALLALDEARFNAELASRFGEYLGAVRVEGPRWSFPLGLQLAYDYIRPRLALVGDAAHAVHPIAGQGFNLGLKDIAALTDVLSEHAATGLDIGHLSVLEQYQQWRRFDSVTLGLGTDVLNRLFSNDIAPVRFARDFGMHIVGKIGPLRRFFMRDAGADTGRLPALMQP